MSGRNSRRVVGGLSAFAVAAGCVVTVGVGAAGAAPVTIPVWKDKGMSYTRTISNGTPQAGDIITSTTKFEWDAIAGGEYIYDVKDVHPTCLTYIEGSAKMNGETPPRVSKGADFVRVEPREATRLSDWPVGVLAGGKTRTFEFQYRVGQDCARDTPLVTTLQYGGSLHTGGVHFTNKGLSIIVPKNDTTTTLAPVVGARVGEPITLSATVVGAAEGDTVDFYNGATKIGSEQVNGSGVATYSWTPTIRGTQTVKATFPGTSKAKPSQSGTLTVDVAQTNVPSTTTLAPVAGAQVGRATALEVTISPSGAGGTVEFKDGTTVLAEVPVDRNGRATYQWVPTAEGSRTIAAVFSGRDGVTGSSTTSTISVAAAPAQSTPSSTAISDIVGARVGTALTVSAQVTGAAGGTVTFKENDVVIGTATVDGTGRASVSWTPGTEGQRLIRAEYSGTATVDASSDEFSVVVAPAPSGGGGGGGTGSAGSLGNLFG